MGLTPRQLRQRKIQETPLPEFSLPVQLSATMKSERSFWLVTALIFALITGITYFPALFGKVPFPNDMVLQFPAWQGMAQSEAPRSYGDIGDLVTAFYPARVFAARAVKEGTLPLWN